MAPKAACEIVIHETFQSALPRLSFFLILPAPSAAHLIAMADSKKGSAYGAPAGDTDFRKTWDLDEYAQKAKDREVKEREEGKARYEAKLAGKKYYKPLTGNETLTSARRTVLDLSHQVGKTQLVPAGAGVGKRGRGAGFYCESCDLTFKDNLQFV
jgi:U4/U6.U5 tri-snRNP component SNU23